MIIIFTLWWKGLVVNCWTVGDINLFLTLFLVGTKSLFFDTESFKPTT